MNKEKFKLSEDFISKYKNVSPNFGFNGVGQLVYRRSYSRLRENHSKEEWNETVERIVNGVFNIQKNHIIENDLPWDNDKALKSAQEMYDRIFRFKFLPPGRSIQHMGTPVTEQKKLFIALFNCAFISTKNIDRSFSYPFTFLMDVSMCGTGCGFDTKGAGLVTIYKPHGQEKNIVIEDTREGWVESVRLLLNSYAEKGSQPIKFDYSKIRAAGIPLKTFGGKSAGPEPLIRLHKFIRDVLDPIDGQKIRSRHIVDLMNSIGVAVVSGGIRRTAENALGEFDDVEFLDLKDYSKNPERAHYGWTSNNSIFAKIGMDYRPISNRIRNNGEPGILWLDNMRAYGRMGELNNNDTGADGCNPCFEIQLEHGELCNLTELFPTKARDFNDFKTTIKYAYMFSKSVTLTRTHLPQTNKVMLRNRRIGLSTTGTAQFITNKGVSELGNWLENGYEYVKELDEEYSDWMCIPRSKRMTAVKPSGSISLLAGATAGIHFPISRFYIRRVRVAYNDPLWEEMKSAGYHVEPSQYEPDTVVIEIPVDAGKGIRSRKDVSMWEQLNIASMFQKKWADNMVSSTISFDPEKEGRDIEHALDYYQYQLKTISFLPNSGHNYKQMPEEEITEDEYINKLIKIKTFNVSGGDDIKDGNYCDSESCAII